MKWIDKISTAIYHASYHRAMKRAEGARKRKNLIIFKKYIYRAEDAWRKIAKIQNKYKQNNNE
jgi:hypothetical protein